MFGATLNTKIGGITPRIVDDNDQIRRITEIALQFELDDELAAGCGEAATDALKHLRSGAQKSAIILLDNLQLRAEFKSGEEIHKIDVVGVRVSAGKPNKEDSLPTARLLVSFATRHGALCWLVDHLGESLQVKLTKRQGDLAV